MASSSTSSSSITLQAKYDVFLSFRGEDTRGNFTSHLYTALCRKQIQTFIDDDGLKRGEEISPALLTAIEESMISVIIFSKDYASSKWCLDELVKILECREKNGQIVMPVFYRITPSDVRKQTGSFKDAFVKHEKQFKKIPEKVQRWRAALTEASNLSGWDSMVIRPESKLVEDIVREILKKLNDISPSNDCEGLIGINSRIDQIKSLLCTGLSDFRIVGIWGMGGIGKTTIAGAVFNQISDQFESCCFISNVREESEKCGIVYLRKQVLSQILEDENITISTPNLPPYIKKRLQRKKVFIVLDDVNNLGQIEYITAGIDRFGPGSRVIVTTRDKQVLCNYGVNNIYEVKGLKYHEALELFSNFAFKQRCPSEEFLELSNQLVNYPKGNPLALKVLGSTLYQKSEGDWKGVLNKLRRISISKIHNVLKISYDELDCEEQAIFLDIACFFKGNDSNHTKKILSSCYLSAQVGFSTLIDKSLMTISNNNKLEMHDLLQEMGWEIVREESFKEPGKRSRLWNHEDVFRVLKNNTGTDAVQGLFLDMSNIADLHLSSGAFENMHNLKFLKFYVPDQLIGDLVNINKVHLPEGLKYLSNELRYLCWYGYPLKSLPSNFSPENLIELNLPCSNVDEQLWAETKHGSNVKLIELHHSDAPEPEHCQSLVKIPSSIQYLTNLCILRLSHCKNLRSFPSNIHFGSLITLNLSYCINLTTFPQISGNIKELYLTGTAIDQVPSSVACLTKLDSLHLVNCTRLKSVSPCIYKLKCLRRLSLSDHSISKTQLSSSIASWKEIRHLFFGSCNITEIPEDICCLSSLVALNLSGNDFESLPTSIKQLSQLKSLYLNDCKMLQSIPELPPALEYLDAVNCRRLQTLPEPPSNLEELDESELQIVSECFYRSSFSSMHFMFTNCLKLNHKADNNILTDSQQRIQHMANVALRLCYEKLLDEIPHSSLCLPGSEIPDWFSHQCTGPSMTIEIPQYWYNIRFIGFALSAIITLDKSYYEDSSCIGVICTYSFANNVEFDWSCLVCYPNHILIESDHIVLGYSPCIDVKDDYTTASFEFIPYNYIKQGPAESLKVKCCGVHPVYVQPNMTAEDLADSEDLTKLLDANTSGSGNVHLMRRRWQQMLTLIAF